MGYDVSDQLVVVGSGLLLRSFNQDVGVCSTKKNF